VSTDVTKHLIDYSTGMEYVKQIKQICYQYHLKLTVILAPFLPTYFEVKKENGTWKSVNKWKQDLKNIVPYSDYFHENVPFTAKDFFDRVHFTPEVGKFMFDALRV